MRIENSYIYVLKEAKEDLYRIYYTKGFFNYVKPLFDCIISTPIKTTISQHSTKKAKLAVFYQYILETPELEEIDYLTLDIYYSYLINSSSEDSSPALVHETVLEAVKTYEKAERVAHKDLLHIYAQLELLILKSDKNEFTFIL